MIKLYSIKNQNFYIKKLIIVKNNIMIIDVLTKEEYPVLVNIDLKFIY